MKPLRILIADDHDLLRRGVRTLLAAHPNWEVCGEARDGEEAIEKAENLKPDIVILDIAMPIVDGMEAAKRIRGSCPKIEILILSLHYSDQLIQELVGAGVRGYIVKSDSDRDLIRAVEALAAHRPFFATKATEVLLGDYSGIKKNVARQTGTRLTPRELQIVQLLAGGMTNKEAAATLGLSLKTVETHRSNVMQKLDLHSMSDLTRYAVRNGIVDP